MTLAPANPDHLTQRELEQALWAAANALRGPVDPGDFKAYVFPVLFYKWISDVYDYHHTQAVDECAEPDCLAGTVLIGQRNVVVVLD